MSPKVSVIIPNYNHARYLPQRIESVLNQTFQDIEVILMDDCSPDDSRSIIAAYAASDARIRVVLNEQNSGSTFKQWNKGIALAKGQYVWLAESDDYAHLELLSELVVCLDAYPKAGLAYCDSISVDEAGKPLQEWKHVFCQSLQTDLWEQEFALPGLDFIRRFMVRFNAIPNASAVLLRRAVLQQVGPANENTRLAGDWLYWVTVLAQSDIAYVPHPYNFFRTHTNNVRSQTATNGILLEETSLVLLRMQELVGRTAQSQQAALRLLDDWFLGVVYGNIPAHRNVAIARNTSHLLGGGTQVAKQWLSFLFSHKLRGARMMLGDGLVYKIFAKGKRTQ